MSQPALEIVEQSPRPQITRAEIRTLFLLLEAREELTDPMIFHLLRLDELLRGKTTSPTPRSRPYWWQDRD